jgi:hypothetical protein
VLNTKTIVIAGAGIAAAAGLALAGASMAGADEPSSATAGSYGYGRVGAPPAGETNGNTDPSKPMRADEQLLTGDTADKVTAAAKAKEPNATIERVETDSDGVYEAHMVRADGTHIIVQIGADFQVTNVIEGGGGGHGGGGGGTPPATGGQGSSTPSTSGSSPST